MRKADSSLHAALSLRNDITFRTARLKRAVRIA